MVQISDVTGITVFTLPRVELYQAGTRLDAETHGEVTRMDLEKDGARRFTTSRDKRKDLEGM